MNRKEVGLGVFLLVLFGFIKKKKDKNFIKTTQTKAQGHKTSAQVSKYFVAKSVMTNVELPHERRAFSAPLANFPPNVIVKAFPSFFIWSKRNNN